LSGNAPVPGRQAGFAWQLQRIGKRYEGSGRESPNPVIINSVSTFVAGAFAAGAAFSIGFASHFVAFQPGAGGYPFLHWVRSSDQPPAAHA